MQWVHIVEEKQVIRILCDYETEISENQVYRTVIAVGRLKQISAKQQMIIFVWI